MRIPRRVNTVLDWTEEHFGALAVVVMLTVVAVVALLAPTRIGLPVAAFILGLAGGGFLIHLRMSRRIARVRREADDLLRENGALRHRNTVLLSGVITREAQETQALVSIPDDEAEAALLVGGDLQPTTTLPELPDEVVAGDTERDR
ncbi:hypothetical protein [Spirillospora albida]|uniref:hypothetical protein n=1 Tax=Spirillospora albida TaxID=58123 RepID=UPI0004BEE981|nr:hypothetical protein [Spirillospora albida]